MRKSTSIPSTKTLPMFKVGDRVRFKLPHLNNSNARRGKIIGVHVAGKKAYPWKTNKEDHCYIIETERRMRTFDAIFTDQHRVVEYCVLDKIG